MLNKGLSDSKGFAALCPEAAVLFVMMIPHLSSHGKMNGDPGYIKGEVCPRISYLTTERISGYLTEITDHTNVKWFQHDGRWWIHSTKFLSEHQKLPADRLGQDSLPAYSGSTHDLFTNRSRVDPPEVEVEVEVEGISAIGAVAPPSLCSPDQCVKSWNKAKDHFAEGDPENCIPKVMTLTPRRRKNCEARIRSLKIGPEKLDEIMNKMHSCDFLCHKKPGSNNGHSDWVATFDWVFGNKDDVIVKILEGQYAR